MKPTTVHKEFNYIMAEKSGLKKFCDGAGGRALQKAEYDNGYNIGQFLNQMMIVNIKHNLSKKDATKTYANYESALQLNEQSKVMYAVDWSLIVRTNPVVGFLIDPAGTCFQSEQFTKFPPFIREEMMKSEEGVAYAAKGGVFAPKAEYVAQGQAPMGQQQIGQVAPIQTVVPLQVAQTIPLAQTAPMTQTAPLGQVAQPVAVAPVAVAPQRRFEMIDTQFTFDQYKGAGHTEATLVAEGKARYVDVAPPVAVAPVVAAPLPVAPVVQPVAVQAVVAQVLPVAAALPVNPPAAIPLGAQGPDDLPF
jgi:hypothetical protein